MRHLKPCDLETAAAFAESRALKDARREEQMRKAKALYAEGLRFSEISRRLGASSTTVAQWVRA